jgi:hypothetical protein
VKIPARGPEPSRDEDEHDELEKASLAYPLIHERTPPMS